MDDRTFKALEYNIIKNQLTTFCVSELGRETAQNLTPVTDYETVLQALTETSEAETILFRRGTSPIEVFDDIRPSLAKAKIGSVLTMQELLRVAHFLKACHKAHAALVKTEIPESAIAGIAESLTPMQEIETEITRCVLSEDELSDNASPQLAQLRRKIKSAHESIREKLNSYIKNTEFQKYLQEPIVTMRSGRYVLPVKSEHKPNVAGIVHDQSATGATLFIEPMAVVEINNNLSILYAQEREEVEKILTQLAAMVNQAHDCLAINLKTMQDLDFAFAKAKLSRSMNAVTPKLNQRGYVNIKRGRHPLIDKKAVVPIDVWLGDKFSILLITGPNTGGKTVTLKTIGLFTLMAQSGLNVPANVGTELTVFDKVFADIGDEQSIEQSLSTFSSHMTNIARILKALTNNSLVLFDELGAGTDPNEGAALAMAILEELRSRGVRCVATTHYSELKAYSLNTAGVENASVEFDVVSLKPTYKLSVGIPGMSNAFLISERLGLDKRIIEKAGEFMSGAQLRFENVLKQAQEHRKAAEAENEAAKALRLETERLHQEIRLAQQKIEMQKEEVLNQARREAKQIREQALKEAAELIEEMKALKEGRNDENLLKMQIKRKSLEKQLYSETPLKASNSEQQVNSEDIKIGQTVFANKLNQDVIVLSLPNAKGDLRIQAGALQMDINIKDISYAKQAPVQKPSTYKVQKSAVSVPLSLDVRGQTVDDASILIDRYLDEAHLANYGEVTIIHGKGTGALRAGIHSFLRRHPRVKSFRAGKYGEGDMGVTVVELK